MPQQPSTDSDGRSEIVAFECIDDDGRFCVVRTTTAEADIRSADDVLLAVAWQDRDYRFTPVELDAEAEDDRVAEFLLPSRLLADGDFTLHHGHHRVALGTPEPHAAGLTSGLTTEQALLVQHDQLVDQARRLAGLRVEMRKLHDRATHAEDALDDAQSRFDVALIGQRGEVQDARRHAAEVEAALADSEERAATLDAALEAGRGLLAREQSERAEVEQRAEEAAAALEELRAESALAAEELEATRRELESERDAHADVELRRTWAEARLEEKTARVAELDELARRRAQEIDAAAAAHLDREAELEAELTIARAGVEHEQGARAEIEALLADARARVAELEAAEGHIAELERQVEQGREDVAAAAAAVEDERAARAAAEGALEEQATRLAESGDAFDARVDALNAQLEAAREGIAEEQALRVQQLEELNAALEAERALRTDDHARLEEKTTRICALEQELRERTAELDAATAPPVDEEVEPELPDAAEELGAVRAELEKARAANAHIAARLKAAEQALAEKEPQERRAPAVDQAMGARLIALDLAMRGAPRSEAARYLSENFELSDSEALLDEVYARA